ncbi:unnamed protein product [Albugo candida]|uniref:Uncharacterized protein n=1 Tax=Albugo candida TaxID=65357 RepID=A0A024FVB7_9STRA|nr:unnamed protein product [Albugo candida]|eukprot:CCI11103.1 unnamed protein product [Albugo candida]
MPSRRRDFAYCKTLILSDEYLLRSFSSVKSNKLGWEIDELPIDFNYWTTLAFRCCMLFVHATMRTRMTCCSTRTAMSRRCNKRGLNVLCGSFHFVPKVDKQNICSRNWLTACVKRLKTRKRHEFYGKLFHLQKLARCNSERKFVFIGERHIRDHGPVILAITSALSVSTLKNSHLTFSPEFVSMMSYALAPNTSIERTLSHMQTLSASIVSILSG